MRAFVLLTALVVSVSLPALTVDAAIHKLIHRPHPRTMLIHLASGRTVTAHLMMMNGRMMVVAPLDAFPSGDM
jgi:hypothetical protein